jgi:hypothetical protein
LAAGTASPQLVNLFLCSDGRTAELVRSHGTDLRPEPESPCLIAGLSDGKDGAVRETGTGSCPIGQVVDASRRRALPCLTTGDDESRLAITVEPLRELSPGQRRQLDDEVDLVAAVMKAKTTLTIGRVPLGPHA